MIKGSSLDGIDNVIEDSDNFAISYCRSTSSKRRELEQKLVTEYYPFKDTSTVKACVFPSGMNTICALFQTVLSSCKDMVPHIILGDEMYCDVKRTVRYFQTIFNFTYQYIDVRDSQKLNNIVKEKGERIRLLFIESCTNPSGQMVDFRMLKNWKNQVNKCLVCVDNTWLTGKVFNPFRYGVDIVLESMTKYVSASNCIGGMMIGKIKIMRDIQNWIRIYGQHLLPIHCQYCIDGIDTIQNRITSSSEITLNVINLLEENSSVNRVLHPRLKSHPTYQLNQQFLKKGLCPSVIVFHISKLFNSKKDIVPFLRLSSLKLETSYGSSYSKIDPWAHTGNHNDYDYPKTKEGGIFGLWIRLSIGYEDSVENIMKGLEPLF